MCKKIVVFLSGKGSTFEAILNAQYKGQIEARIVKVLSDNPNALGLEKARRANIDCAVINPKDYEDKERFEKELINCILPLKPDLIVLAGYMRILGKKFVDTFKGIILNIHPSLLPKYPGLNTHKRAIVNKEKYHGTSVHFVTERLDAGPVILQAVVKVKEEDTAKSLEERVKEKEAYVYPKAIQWFLQGRVYMQDEKAYLDGNLLDKRGIQEIY